jgi:hypothetical protein
MKLFIKRILREEVEGSDDYHKKILSYLIKSGYDGRSNYVEVINFLKHSFGISGMESFEIYQLLKDNWRSMNSEDELIKTDITKKTIRTANIRGRELVLNKIPFKGSNTHSKYYDNGSYVVFSYDWYPIYLYKDGQWFENEDGYSMSTKKQMSQLRPHGQGDIILTSKGKLWDIINGR